MNLFVARFIGEINQFDGHVVRRIDDKHVEVTAEGADWIVQTDYPFAVNDKVHVLLRPEDVRLTKPELAENTVHIEGQEAQTQFVSQVYDCF